MPRGFWPTSQLSGPQKGAYQAWAPFSLGSQLKLWYRGNVATSGSEVTAWTDLVAGYALAQGTSANRPTTRTIAGKTAIDLDGSNDYLVAASNLSTVLGSPGQYEITAVWVADTLSATAPNNGKDVPWIVGTGTSGRIWHAVGNAAAYHGNASTGGDKIATSGAAPSTGTVYRTRAYFDATNIAVKLGSGSTATTAMTAQSGTNHDFPLVIGRNAATTAYFDGAICEVAITSVLSAADRALLDTWCSTQWGATV